MNHDEILVKLSEMVAKKNQSNLSNIDDFPNAEIQGTLGIESLEVLRLVVEIEVAFKVNLPDAGLLNLKTFGDLAHAIAGASTRDEVTVD